MVQRRVRQHETKCCDARGDGGRDAVPGCRRHDDDRALRAFEQAGVLGRDDAALTHGCQVGRHQGERFCVAALEPAQTSHGFLVGGVAGELEAAQTFYRDDGAPEQKRGRCSDRIRPGRSGFQPGAGAAGRAGDRLRMEAAIRRVMIFYGAGLAQRERPHRRARTIVRDRFDDRKPRAAMRAIGERIAIAPRTRIADFRFAVEAGSGVRYHAGAHHRCAAGCDTELCLRRHPGGGTLDPFNAGERRGSRQQAINEFGNSFRRTADMDGDALAVICHRSA